MKHIDLFSGIGGFSLASKLVWGNEHEPVLFCEINKQCQSILCRHFPNVPILEDIKNYDYSHSADIITGGDPCPIRSKARTIWRSGNASDYSGYFLNVVAGCRPRWVLRENVPASDDKDFYAALELLGYRSIIIRTNAYSYTAQNRTRDIIVGCSEETKSIQFRLHFERQSRKRFDTSKYRKEEGYPCLTTHNKRYDSRDGYIWDGSGSLRVADSDERTKLAGFPDGWLDGLSNTAVARVTGNAIVPQVAYEILRCIRAV